jgi:hypothetical protein
VRENERKKKWRKNKKELETKEEFLIKELNNK